MAKAISILDAINSKPYRPPAKTWLTRLPIAAQREIQGIKDAWKAGKIDKPSTVVYAAIVEKYPQITVNSLAIRRWLNG
jgi:hypothetical protein